MSFWLLAVILKLGGKDPAFGLICGAGFSCGGEKASQQLLLDLRSCLLFFSSNLLYFLFLWLGRTSAEGIE